MRFIGSCAAWVFTAVLVTVGCKLANDGYNIAKDTLRHKNKVKVTIDLSGKGEA